MMSLFQEAATRRNKAGVLLVLILVGVVLTLNASQKENAPLPRAAKVEQQQKEDASLPPPAKVEQQQKGVSPQKKRRRIPNLLIAGAQKGGTSAINTYLKNRFRHDVCGPSARPVPGMEYTSKEAHIFDDEKQMALGLEHYESLFEEHCNENHSIVVDATPNYMAHPDNVYQMYKEHGTADTVKILFSLREPVSREISWYGHLVRVLTVSKPIPRWARIIQRPDGSLMTFQEHMEANIIPPLGDPQKESLSAYSKWLDRWFQLFDRKQIMVTKYDDLKRNSTDFLLRLHDFLELPVRDKWKVNRPLARSNSQHVAREQTPSCETQEALSRVFAPYNDRLYKLMENSGGAPKAEKRPFTKFQFKCKRQ